MQLCKVQHVFAFLLKISQIDFFFRKGYNDGTKSLNNSQTQNIRK